MNTQIFDIAVGIYGQMLRSGLSALIPVGVALMVPLAVIEARWGLAWAIIDGYVNVTKLCAVIVSILVQVATLGWLIVNINRWTTEAMNLFLSWSVAGSGLVNAKAVIWDHPSHLIDTGFLLLAPLKGTIAGAGLLDQALYLVLYVIGVLFFAGIATTVMATQIAFILATLIAAVLLPFILLRWTMFLASGTIHWLGSTLVQVFVLGLTVAGTIIWLGQLPPLNASGALLTVDDALTALIVSGIAFTISWFLPGIAAAKMGGGGGVGLTHILAGPLAVIGAVSAGTRLASQVSHMVRSRHA